MKKFILFLFLAKAGLATDIVFYNPISSPITNRVTNYELSLNEVVYRNATNALIITNRIAQIGSGVNAITYLSSVVDGQTVRLLTQAELDLISSNNVVIAKYEARVFATNVVNGTEGLNLFLRSLGEANWFYINQIRTNAGQPSLSRAAYLNMINNYINSFGQ